VAEISDAAVTSAFVVHSDLQVVYFSNAAAAALRIESWALWFTGQIVEGVTEREVVQV
jgi:hypothetical protein